MANTNAYARKSVSTSGGTEFTAIAAGGETHNDNEIAFAAASGGNWGTVTHFAVVDSGTWGAGDFLLHGALTASKVVNDGDVFRFTATSLSVTLA